jgi:pyruvate/2-oxoglutarate/acetoin dehydrogenase E1 component
VDIDTATVRRAGTSVTIVTYGATLYKALDAARAMAADGIETEVIDLRTLRPLDMPTILSSVRKTRRVVIADEGWRSGSLSAEIAARLAEQLFYELEAPIARVCTAEVPIPYPKHLEDAALPSAAAIAGAARALVH